MGASRHHTSRNAHPSLNHDPKQFTHKEVGSRGQVPRPSPQSWQVAEPRSSRFTTHTPFSGWGNAAAILKPSLVDSGSMGKHTGSSCVWRCPGPASPSGTGAFPHWSRAVPQPPLSSATHRPQNTGCHLRQMTAPPWVSSSPCWSQGETSSSHRFKALGRRVPGAPQGADTLICSGACWTEGHGGGWETD